VCEVDHCPPASAKVENKFSFNLVSCSPSSSCYCYQKDKEAKPGSLQTRVCSFG